MQSEFPMHLSPRCGTRTRSGSQCKLPTMLNGRCWMHCGISSVSGGVAGVIRTRRIRTKEAPNLSRHLLVFRLLGKVPGYDAMLGGVWKWAS
jgi:hypothetical protein